MSRLLLPWRVLMVVLVVLVLVVPSHLPLPLPPAGIAQGATQRQAQTQFRKTWRVLTARLCVLIKPWGREHMPASG